MKNNKFCGMTRQQTLEAIGMPAYVEKYGKLKDGPDLTTSSAQKDLSKWRLTVPFAAGSLDVICCPEDRRCSDTAEWSEGNSYDVPAEHAVCEKCELPVCKECWSALWKTHKQPKLSLANDLWTGYIPDIIYEKNCTYMELLAASVCSPTLMSIQYEFYKQHVDKNLEHVHMPEHRTGARGNFTGDLNPIQNSNKFCRPS